MIGLVERSTDTTIILFIQNINDNLQPLERRDASTADSQPLTQVSNTAATKGLTSGFGMGPGRSLLLWPA